MIDQQLFDAVDYLLGQNTTPESATLRQGLAVLHYRDQDLPAEFPAAIHGQEPTTPQSEADAADAELAAAQARADAARAKLAEQPSRQGVPPGSDTPTPPAVGDGARVES